ncbi:MAG: hypothetical protein JXR46_10530 [Calditrichaceae bacterium]|nr:hypothetical protein [Calditrichaceae bacterium]
MQNDLYHLMACRLRKINELLPSNFIMKNIRERKVFYALVCLRESHRKTQNPVDDLLE